MSLTAQHFVPLSGPRNPAHGVDLMAKAPIKPETETATDLTARMDALESLVAKAAPLSDFESLSETAARLSEFNALSERVRDIEAAIRGGEALDELRAKLAEMETGLKATGAAAVAVVETGGDFRAALLKVHHQIEAIANHLNIRLPA